MLGKSIKINNFALWNCKFGLINVDCGHKNNKSLTVLLNSTNGNMLKWKPSLIISGGSCNKGKIKIGRSN